MRGAGGAAVKGREGQRHRRRVELDARGDQLVQQRGAGDLQHGLINSMPEVQPHVREERVHHALRRLDPLPEQKSKKCCLRTTSWTQKK